MKKSLFFTLCLSGTALAAGPYVVKRGDILSEIALKTLGRPIYKEHGSLARLLTLNPDIKSPDLIFPGEKIALEPRRQIASDAAPIAVVMPVVAAAPVAQALPLAQQHVQSLQPQPQPQPPARESSADDAGPVSQLGFDAGFEYFRINSTDKSSGASATLLSNLNPAARLHWDLDWTRDWSTRFLFGYQDYSLQNGTDSRMIQNSSGALYDFELSLIRNWNEGSHTGISAGFADQLFEHSSDPSSITLDTVGTPELKLTHQQDLARFRTAAFGVSVTGELLFPGSGQGYDTNLGYGGEAALYVRHEMKSLTLQGNLYGGYQSQNSALVDQNESKVGAFLSFSWRLGE